MSFHICPKYSQLSSGITFSKYFGVLEHEIPIGYEAKNNTISTICSDLMPKFI
ncbi:hypothetical protein SAMN05444380_103131 [Thermophagus xiamenensis]|uniref:Uncharacterized protein n=1 Tax=Thermophagus xiamenensis TaxID=385682 RepID=A0A1I1VYG5_9BACT|nr:hypothetical protein SAMN05444380_103131 [Thermophagus xiamenensis]